METVRRGPAALIACLLTFVLALAVAPAAYAYDLDDGVKTLAEAIGLVKRMLAAGVERFTFTPHIAFPNMLNNKENIGNTLLILRRYLEKEDIRVPMEASAEYRMGEFMLDLIERDAILASAEREVLVEHSFFAPSCFYTAIITQKT